MVDMLLNTNLEVVDNPKNYAVAFEIMNEFIQSIAIYKIWCDSYGINRILEENVSFTIEWLDVVLDNALFCLKDRYLDKQFPCTEDYLFTTYFTAIADLYPHYKKANRIDIHDLVKILLTVAFYVTRLEIMCVETYISFCEMTTALFEKCEHNDLLRAFCLRASNYISQEYDTTEAILIHNESKL